MIVCVNCLNSKIMDVIVCNVDKFNFYSLASLSETPSDTSLIPLFDFVLTAPDLFILFLLLVNSTTKTNIKTMLNLFGPVNGHHYTLIPTYPVAFIKSSSLQLVGRNRHESVLNIFCVYDSIS